MTPCHCCGKPVWVMYAPALCDPCTEAGCKPSRSGDLYNSEYGEIIVVTSQTPCTREAD